MSRSTSLRRRAGSQLFLLVIWLAILSSSGGSSGNGGGNPGMMSAVDAAPTSYGNYEQDRERRRQERERRRQQSKPHPGRKKSKEQKQQQQQQKKEGTEGEDGKDFEYMLNELSKFSILQQPRDVFEGSIKALQSVFVGTSVGLISFIGLPILALYSQLRTDEGKPEDPSPILGLIVGGVLGGVTGFVSTLAGVATATFQFGFGVWNTFGSVKSAMQGMKWDDRTRTWIHYSIKEEAEELNLGSSAGGGSANRRSTSSVQDTGFYDILGVQPDASAKQIKRAYYQKAKTMHPDKRPDDPEKAAEDFLKLHSAYQTLSDDKKRADYDKYGISGDGDGSGGMPFDISVFFAVMFDFQQVEPYIGELTIASFIDGIIKLSQLSNNQDLSDGMPRLLFEQIWGSDTQPRKRQLEIAQNLLSRIETYVAGGQSAAEFRQSAADEADRISRGSGANDGSTDVLGFTDKLLDTIGTGLTLEAGHYLAFHSRIPFAAWPFKGTLYAASRKKNKWMRRLRSATKTFQLVRNAFTNGAITLNEEKEKENDDDDSKPYEDLLPDLIDMAGAYILSDISKTLQGACWRLFFDSGVDAATRTRRAEAMEILGQEFLRRGRPNKSGNKTECMDKDARSEGVKEKIKRAFEISQMKAQGQSSFHEE